MVDINLFAYMNPEDGMPDEGLHEHGDHGRENRGGRPRYRGPRGGRPGKENGGYYLRCLIPCKMVGAVIGTSGNKIKKITEATNTSIDIHRKEDRREIDKLVTIRGNPDDCSMANMQIHKLMREETDESLRR
ncbi:insulin-like growth factor 2 mRNA-binding protein 1 isoform X2 [Exaiptasia diaphana]|uniref:K Homology domain-containing protein n=1 Tax=Exaiptasia diaphana TaxID=2652724 RepID=A0A913XED4_EXADI|nr:insulin-like growth factor 2 mRNA-binding protein 1 isoform X2 [Exaiptasia diaphana]